MEWKTAFSENRASANAEMLPAIPAAIRHRLLVLDCGNVRAAAVTAIRFVTPAVALEVCHRSFLVGEALEKLVEADGFRLLDHET